MNVAVILTGHMRCWEQVFPNFEERVLRKYNPDVFINTWEDEAYWDPHSTHGIVENAPVIDHESIIKTYNPVDMIMENYDDFKDDFISRAERYKNFYHVPKNIISMLYKIGQGGLMMEDHMFKTGKHYDLVIRMRPDLVFNEELPDFDPNSFYTLGYRNHMGQGTSDMIQVGNSFMVSLFTKLLHHLPHVYRQTGLLCPHVISEKYIRNLGLPWKEFMIDKTIMHTPLGEYKHKSLYQQ
jgi:hypothetical protein